MWVAEYQRKEPPNFLIISEKLKDSWRGQNRGKLNEGLP